MPGGDRGPRRDGRSGRGQGQAADAPPQRRARRSPAVSPGKLDARWQGRPLTAGQVAFGLVLAVGIALLTAHSVERWRVRVAQPALAPPVATPPSGRTTRARSLSTPSRPLAVTPPAATGATPSSAVSPALSDVAVPGSPGAAGGATAPPSSGAASAPRPVDLALADVRFVAESHGPQIRACYDRVFRHDPAAPTGRIELSFSLVPLGDFGRAIDIRSELNLLGNAVVESCLIELLAEWSFPRPLAPGAAPPRLRYPFLFTAAP